MATVLRLNIVNTLPIFVRDVLRQNLIDTQSPARDGTEWVFKGSTEKEFDPPIVFIGEVRNAEKTFNTNKSKRHAPELIMIIRVWADKLADRDSLVNQISNILTDYTKTDGINSINSQQLTINAISSRNTDALSTSAEEPTKIKRVGEMTINWVYSGA